MTEFVFITGSDLHISDNGPRNRLDNYKEAMLDKLDQMGRACNKLKADAALFAGDLFNLKNPAKNSHRLNQDIINVIKKFSCPFYAIEGNHDITADKLESLVDQPLGVLFADKTILQLREEVIEKNGYKVSLVGIPYTNELKIEDIKLPSREGCVSQICLMHIYSGLKAGNLFNERLYGYDELAKLPADVFVIGHYHIDQGIYDENGKYFVNIGSMSRGSLSEEDINHLPQIGMIKITIDNDNVTYKLNSFKLKVKPASEIFDLTKKMQEKQDDKQIQEFVEKLAASAVQETIKSDKDIDHILDAMDLAKVVRDRVLGYIRQVKV